MELDVIKNILCCPSCCGQLSTGPEFYVCEKCSARYANNKGAIFFLAEAPASSQNEDLPLVIKIKYYLRNFPWVYEVCGYLLGAISVNVTAKKFVKGLARGLNIINLGAGTKILRDDVVNVDFQLLPGVDIVADAGRLPFRDESVDAVVCDYILEHAENTQAIIKEMVRVLKGGGLVYLKVPFMMAFHSAPDDFYRWTKPGVAKLAKDFEPIEIKIACGPSSAFVWVASEWLATLLSFNLMALYQFWLIFFTLILAPLKLFDFLIANYKSADIAAGGFYFIGEKK